MASYATTACSRVAMCYLAHSIKALILMYREYRANMEAVDVRYRNSFQRGAHYARISLADNIASDLLEILNTISPSLYEDMGDNVEV